MKSLGFKAVMVESIKTFHDLQTNRRVFTSRSVRCCSISTLHATLGRSRSISAAPARRAGVTLTIRAVTLLGCPAHYKPAINDFR